MEGVTDNRYIVCCKDFQAIFLSIYFNVQYSANPLLLNYRVIFYLYLQYIMTASTLFTPNMKHYLLYKGLIF